MVREFMVVVSIVIGMTRKFVGVASIVIGLVCYALSTSFHCLIGKWNPLKMSMYIMFSFIICLAIIFPEAWQQWRIFRYKAHFTFLVLASTTLYSFYLDRKLKTKPDTYGIISSAAFATASLCISKQIECGFLDLLYFFCGVLITQLMAIKPLFAVVGVGFSYLLVILRSNLPNEPGGPRSRGDQPGQVSRSRHASGAVESRSTHASGAADALLPPRSTHASGATDALPPPGSTHASGATDALPPPRSSHAGGGGGRIYMAHRENSYRSVTTGDTLPLQRHSHNSYFNKPNVNIGGFYRQSIENKGVAIKETLDRQE